MSGGSRGSEQTWAQLESIAPSRGEFRVRDCALRVDHGAVLLALDAAGLRHVLVPIAPDAAEVHDRRSGGVHLVTRLLIDEAGQQRFLDLACQKAHLNGVFAHLASDALNELAAQPASALQACRKVLQRWRAFLDREAVAVLSTEALCGLFGELWHLRRITQLGLRGVLSWQGPHGARHDFSCPGTSLEIKTTLRHTEWKFRIHGLDQLDKPPDTDLYLCAMRLELNGAAGLSVPDLIQEILDAGTDSHELLNRLSLVGYDPQHEQHYSQSRFHVLNHRTYEVTQSFPRLVSASFAAGSLPAGICDIDYTVDLAISPAPTCTAAELAGVHGALAGARDAGAPRPAV